MGKGIKMKNSLDEEIYPCPYYPVGSIYMSAVEINPSTFFGGTWEQIKDRFLLCAGNTYKAGNTGGAATHTLNINEMPSHNHRNTYARWMSYGLGAGSIYWGFSADYSDGTQMLKNEGGNQAHNNMPPYLVVFVWKRTG